MNGLHVRNGTRRGSGNCHRGGRATDAVGRANADTGEVQLTCVSLGISQGLVKLNFVAANLVDVVDVSVGQTSNSGGSGAPCTVCDVVSSR